MSNKEVDKLAKKIWDYHRMNQKLKKADCILVLGGNDIRVAERGAELFLQGYAPLIIFSGGKGKVTKKIFKKPEAQFFAEVATKKGIPKEKILIEDKSTNTSENIKFTKELLRKKNIEIGSFLVIDTPYKERRIFATFKKLYPKENFSVTSPKIKFEDCSSQHLSKEECINLMVCNLQRIKDYPIKRFQIYQEIPKNVLYAYKKLVDLGFTKYLLK